MRAKKAEYPNPIDFIPADDFSTVMAVTVQPATTKGAGVIFRTYTGSSYALNILVDIPQKREYHNIAFGFPGGVGKRFSPGPFILFGGYFYQTSAIYIVIRP